jgi:hypothetical protein
MAMATTPAFFNAANRQVTNSHDIAIPEEVKKLDEV